MTKKMLIDATHTEETRVVVVDGTKVEEFDFETVNKRQLAGNIYLAKVTRVEPSLQAAFVDYGGNRHGFLAFSEIHPDYYQIPVADRQALLAEERAYARSLDEDEGQRPRRSSTQRPKPAARAEGSVSDDAVQTGEIAGMDVVDLGEDAGADSLYNHASAQPSVEAAEPEAHAENGADGEERTETYRAMDHASDIDDEIESIAEEDVAEEISQTRKPRHRRYKIQEVVKVRQIMLVQVVKEERGNKGAALTTYLSLAGRYCVLMPNTARGGGISRKITNIADRKKLKEIAGEIEVPEGAGLIIRTAGSQRTKTEIKRDYEYLQRLWEQIRELTMKSIAPAPIYEEGTLIKRVIRDLYNRDIEEVLVEGPDGYRVAKDFMRMIMPSHAKNVQHYQDQQPLFAKFGVETYLASMFNPTVQLKSGGYIVIGITEALVAIDVNSGRATKEGSIEETALKTNLEAAEEVARQLRLRDLAGLIVIDFIDMEERRNNASVEKRLKDKLKTDRARIQVGRISGFGLMEMSRQRLRPGMLEASTAPCNHCHGTGLIRSDDSLALMILRQLEEEGTRKRSKEVLLKAPVAIINFLMNQKREHIAGIETRYGMAVRIEADPTLISPDFSIEKFKTAIRVVHESLSPVISLDMSSMADMDDEDDEIEDEIDVVEDAPAERAASAAPANGGAANGAADRGDGTGPKKKRRRRRRRKGGTGTGAGEAGGEFDDDGDEGEDAGDVGEAVVAEAGDGVAAAPAAKRSRSRSRSSSSRSGVAASATAASNAAVDAGVTAEAPEPVAEAVEAPADGPAGAAPVARPSRSRAPRSAAKPAGEAAAVADVSTDAVAQDDAPKKTTRSRVRKPSAKKLADMAAEEAAQVPEPVAVADPVAVAVAPVAAPVAVAAVPVAMPAPVLVAVPAALAEVPVADIELDENGEPKPKKRGWWSLGR